MSSEADVTGFLTEYYRTFGTLDIAAILPFFHEPTMIMGPPGVFVAPDASVLTTFLKPGIEDLRNRGYTGSELQLRSLALLSHTAAFATGVAVRYGQGGTELERVGVSYLLHKSASGWKIAVLVIHGTDPAH